LHQRASTVKSGKRVRIANDESEEIVTEAIILKPSQLEIFTLG